MIIAYSRGRRRGERGEIADFVIVYKCATVISVRKELRVKVQEKAEAKVSKGTGITVLGFR